MAPHGNGKSFPVALSGTGPRQFPDPESLWVCGCVNSPLFVKYAGTLFPEVGKQGPRALEGFVDWRAVFGSSLGLPTSPSPAPPTSAPIASSAVRGAASSVDCAIQLGDEAVDGMASGGVPRPLSNPPSSGF